MGHVCSLKGIPSPMDGVYQSHWVVGKSRTWKSVAPSGTTPLSVSRGACWGWQQVHGKIKGMLTPEEENEHRIIQSSGTFLFVKPPGVCLPLPPGFVYIISPFWTPLVKKREDSVFSPQLWECIFWRSWELFFFFFGGGGGVIYLGKSLVIPLYLITLNAPLDLVLLFKCNSPKVKPFVPGDLSFA